MGAHWGIIKWTINDKRCIKLYFGIRKTIFYVSQTSKASKIKFTDTKALYIYYIFITLNVRKENDTYLYHFVNVKSSISQIKVMY